MNAKASTRTTFRKDARAAHEGGARSAFAFSDATPIYVRLILLFRRNIESGDWPVGERIPVLNSLAEQFGVSRATVRQAMSFLENEGLVSGARGRGTFVVAKPEREPWLDIADDWKALVRQSEMFEADWVEIAKPLWEPNLSDITDGKALDKYHVIRRVLMRNHLPYLIGTSYVDQRIADAVGLGDFAKRPVLEIIDPYLAHIDQSTAVDTADAETAYLLQIPLSTPTVIVRRAGLNKKGEIVYQSEGIFRGDFVRLTRAID